MHSPKTLIQSIQSTVGLEEIPISAILGAYVEHSKVRIAEWHMPEPSSAPGAAARGSGPHDYRLQQVAFIRQLANKTNLSNHSIRGYHHFQCLAPENLRRPMVTPDIPRRTASDRLGTGVDIVSAIRGGYRPAEAPVQIVPSSPALTGANRGNGGSTSVFSVISC